MEEKELQQKYLEYQMLDERIKQFHQQLQAIDQQVIEVMATLQSIEDFASVKEDSEILVPINNGIFAKAALKKEDNLLVNVGSSVVVSKSIDETKELIEKQKTEIQEVRKKVAQNINTLVAKASEIEKELNTMLSARN